MTSVIGAVEIPSVPAVGCENDSEEAIAAWKGQLDHASAQQEGRARWYASYDVRVARVERAYGFDRAP